MTNRQVNCLIAVVAIGLTPFLLPLIPYAVENLWFRLVWYGWCLTMMVLLLTKFMNNEQ